METPVQVRDASSQVMKRARQACLFLVNALFLFPSSPRVVPESTFRGPGFRLPSSASRQARRLGRPEARTAPHVSAETGSAVAFGEQKAQKQELDKT